MRFVLLLIAAVIAVATGVAALQYIGKNTTAPTQTGATNDTPANFSGVNTVEVMVAKTPIAVGTVLDESMIEKQPWPEHLVLDGFITDKSGSLVGKVTRAPMQAREPFNTAKLANPNDPSFLAAALPEGMRAVTLATDAISGIAGYVFPGDRVDVILTHNIPQDIQYERTHEGAARSSKPELSEVLIGNVRVLAVNVRSASLKETSGSITPNSVTVEVNEEQAQAIRLAEKNGSLSLALRSLKDQDKPVIPPATPLAELTRAGGEMTGDDVRVVRGAGKDSDSVGGASFAKPEFGAPIGNGEMGIRPAQPVMTQ